LSPRKYLPEGQRAWVRAIVVRAYKQTDVATARRLLQDLARRLDDRYPSAAASVREGLEETLTVITLGLSERLRQSLATTNPIESLISRTACEAERQAVAWRPDGAAMDRRRHRRLRGHADMPKLVAALRARDQQLGLTVSVENVA
jgi:putative transposase